MVERIAVDRDLHEVVLRQRQYFPDQAEGNDVHRSLEYKDRDDRDDLGHGFDLAPHIGGDNVALCGGDEPYRGHGELAENDDDQWDRAAQSELDKAHQHGDHEDLVGERIGEFAEVGDQVIAAGDLAVERVGDRSRSEQQSRRGEVEREVDQDRRDHERHQNDAQDRQFIRQVHFFHRQVPFRMEPPFGKGRC